MDQKKIGQFLKSLRSEKELTQEQLAQHFNVSSRSVSRWETGNNLPDISLLVEIADFYEVDVREIIDGERKHEKQAGEVHEVAEHLAEYAGKEKSRFLTFIQITGIIGTVISAFLVIFLSLSFEKNAGGIVQLLTSVLLLMTVSVITLYVTGLLQKIVKNRKSFFRTVMIVTAIILGYSVLQFLKIVFVTVLLFFSMASEKIEVYSDVSMYEDYFNVAEWNNDNRKFYNLNADDMFEVFPKTIHDKTQVEDFNLTYYNPWDAQYVTYLTICYDRTSYDAEIKRLYDIGRQEYIGYYSVSGEPAGYDIISMSSDEYHGFVYAMIPEGDEDNTTITYVGIWFCNYFLDLDIHEYLPDEYLLEGFDATDDNPYRSEMLK